MGGRTGIGGARVVPRAEQPGKMIGSRSAELVEADGWWPPRPDGWRQPRPACRTRRKPLRSGRRPWMGQSCPLFHSNRNFKKGLDLSSLEAYSAKLPFRGYSTGEENGPIISIIADCEEHAGLLTPCKRETLKFDP